MAAVSIIQAGKYQHYKGNFYEVIGVGQDTETEEKVVIYRPLYKSDVAYWVRLYAMFAGEVMIGDGRVLRFTKVSD